MSVRIPACTTCHTNKYIVPDRSLEKAGTIVGCAIGAGTAFAVSMESTEEVGEALGISSLAMLAAGVILKVLLGAITGGVPGNKVGKLADESIRARFYCTKCGKAIQG